MRQTRRDWIRSASILAAGTVLPTIGCSGPVIERKSAPSIISGVPGKAPMLLLNDRPPCLETPWNYFREVITPNEAFYVRWHLQSIPTYIDVRDWRLRVDGAVESPIELSMDELSRLGDDEVIAVNQCSGNSRSFAKPGVPGVQWKNGAMGNARWSGVSLAKILKRAGLKSEAAQVVFDGLDEGIPETVPDFIKSLSVEQALRPEVIVATSMNNSVLPALNGFPARLVVPGWYATYWVKALTRITVLSGDYDGFWMAKAYKLPKGPNGNESPADLSKEMTPISRMNVRSFVTDPFDGTVIPAGKPCILGGIAFDGGSGIRSVEVSVDQGANWTMTELGSDLGRYSFRRWNTVWSPKERGVHRILVRATSRDGETQPMTAGWNRSGYMRNVVEAISLKVI